MTLIQKTVQFRAICKKQRHVVLKFKNPRVGSSETTREAPYQKNVKKMKNKIFNRQQSLKYFKYISKNQTLALFKKANKNRISVPSFSNFYEMAPPHVRPNLDEHFLEWFIGFAEGDGTFYIKRPRKKNPKPRLIFEVGQKDPKVLYLIKKELGFGHVNSFIRKGVKYFVYRVSSRENIQRIIQLFNGNLVLTKRKIQFHNWLKRALRLKLLPLGFKVKTFSQSFCISKKTAWLSGFIDAEGCFHATVTTSSPGCKNPRAIRQKLAITQKHVYDETSILQSIGKLFNAVGKVQFIYNKRISAYPTSYKTPYRRIEMASLGSHLLAIEYLTKFPLKTMKHISFLRWKRVVEARCRGDHLKMDRLESLDKLCKEINAATKD